ncbi:MAG: winged helix-turn-helix transcriptional regulator [Candidatus Thorarchaeota archaeon]|jgi:DNA-binding Lrp family transcriptional regulator
MDILDKKILTELTKNCRVSYKDLSNKVGITANAVKKRVEKLVNKGTLYAFTIRPSLNTMNANIAIALIETDGSESPAEFIESLGENEMVGEVNPIITKDRGFYLVISDYIESNGILNLGSFFRTLQHVENVELHPVITDPFYHGNRVEFKPLELRVMKYLSEDARMPIVEISEKTRLSARRVRNILDRLIEEGGVSFSIRWNTAAAGAIRFFIAMEYNPRETEFQDVVDWLQEEYPKEFWLYWISTNKPLVFGSFTVDTIEEAREISMDMQKITHLSSIATWMCYPPKKFRTYPEKWFEELLRDG